MADIKITALVADTSPTVDDLVLMVNDPGGSPATRKVTIANLLKMLGPILDTALTEDTGPTFDDFILTVDDPLGSPTTTKASIGNIAKSLGWTDVRKYMDGVSGRPTWATWYANQTTTNLDSVLAAAASAAAGGILFFPLGTFLTSTGFTISANTTVTGLGKGSKILTSSIYLTDLPAPDGPGASAIIYVAQNAGNVVIKDLSIVGKFAGTSGTTFGVYLGTGSYNCIVENNWLEDNSWSGILVHGTGHKIQGNHTKNNAIDGFEITNANHIDISHNYSDSDAAAAANGVGGIEIAVTTSSTNISITDNRIINSQGEGIITSPGAGVSLTDLTISRNQIITPAKKGINVAVVGATQTNVIISDNIVDTPQGSGALGYGIFLYDVTNFTVRGNHVFGATVGSGPSGLRIDGASAYGVLTDNIISANWVGLEITGTSDYISLLNNQIYGNTVQTLFTTSGTHIGIPIMYQPIITFANSATPSAMFGNVFLTGGTTTIANILNGYVGQEIKIISEHTITITDGTNIFLAGSANFDMVATDTLTLIQKADGKWYELSRSVN